ncbi:MAG: hypothetical protein HZA91_11080 [Verrucomicrobia bacterium]|nr:hypothetical protein [Verrucomicrobiota bacterium]
MTEIASQSPVTRNFRWAGLACVLIGIAMFFYAGLRFMESMTQVDAAQKNYALVHEQWDRIAQNPAQSAKLAQALSSSTHQLALTNRRLKIAILGLSVLLAGAGGMLWFSGQRR